MPGEAAIDAPIAYLALGDSYTIGEAIDPAGRWPALLVEALRAEGLDIDDPRIIATTGWTTAELSAAIDAEEPLGEFDLVSLLIGVNNQYRGLDLDEYGREFADLLRRAIGFAGERRDRVVVLSIPDWGVTPFAANNGRERRIIARQIDAFNDVAKTCCAACGVAFVDITPVSREHGAEPRMLAEDQLHPSAAMHAEWMRLALPVARRLLGGADAP